RISLRSDRWFLPVTARWPIPIYKVFSPWGAFSSQGLIFSEKWSVCFYFFTVIFPNAIKQGCLGKVSGAGRCRDAGVFTWIFDKARVRFNMDTVSLKRQDDKTTNCVRRCA